MTDNEITLGEIARTCATLSLQLAELKRDVNTCLGPITLLKYQAETAEADIHRLNDEVAKVSARSAWVSGAIAAVGFLAQFIPWPGKS